MTEPMSPTAFKWFITFLTGGLAGTWFFVDAVKLYRASQLDRADAVVRDQQFGYVMGMVIGAVGVIGCLMFWNVI
jgi:hypothetical protein